MDARPQLARSGEDLAAALYRRAGFEIVSRNHRTRYGELDLIARKGRLLVFCEVKTRRTDRWGAPAEAVGWDKQRRLRQLATEWLAQHRPGRVEIRFDVVSVLVGDGAPEVQHIPAAF
ncbi:MAG: YraN family protein [Actinomycetota bacterium]